MTFPGITQTKSTANDWTPHQVDCGDVPITPFDAAHAFKQMEQGYRQVLFHPTSTRNAWDHPRLVSLGGDHSIVLPILRSLKSVYGPISVIHLDSHLDTQVALSRHRLYCR